VTDPQTRYERIKRKIADSEAELLKGRASDGTPAERISNLARDYPLATMAGGMAVGLLIGALLPKSAGRKLARSAVAAATAASELGITYGRQAIEAANEAGRDGREKFDGLGERLGELGSSASDAAGRYGKRAITAAADVAESARDVGVKLAREARRLTSNIRH
jgi:hypothetical protein